jgi:hypothetical protein
MAWDSGRRTAPAYQPQQSVLKRQFGQRQTACIRYISAPHRSQWVASSAAERGGVFRAEKMGVMARVGVGFGVSDTARL